MVALWNDDARFVLIEEIRKRHEIWESRKERYGSTERKKELYLEIAETINSCCVAPSQIFTEDDVRTQWKNLKDTFKRKMKKRQADIEAGVEDTEPTWRFWSKMLFINQPVEPSPLGINGNSNDASNSLESLLSSLVEKQITDESNSFDGAGLNTSKLPLTSMNCDSFQYNTKEMHPNHQVISSDDTEANSQHYSIQSTISLNQSPRKAQKRRTTDFDEDFAKNNIEDEFTWFGRIVSVTLRRFSEIDKILALNVKKQIFDLIYDYEVKQLLQQRNMDQ
ncbi:unnamed protein product [Dracunculus medinensis]|uniref:MADF domain-containing protein n=1 Tax=Dracunculus medinensis TaxID=318479 RepID=A0A0N4U7D9_DRAME|nr:unnamed protein product [Dracunculus medinensis]